MNQDKMNELKELSRILDTAAYRVGQISSNIDKALEGKSLGERDENDAGSLSGQDLLDALSEANKNGHWKGWTFSELIRGGSVLPGTARDELDNIVKHTSIASYGNDKGEITDITIMVTDEDGTRYIDFAPKPTRKSMGTPCPLCGELLQAMVDVPTMMALHVARDCTRTGRARETGLDVGCDRDETFIAEMMGGSTVEKISSTYGVDIDTVKSRISTLIAAGLIH